MNQSLWTQTQLPRFSALNQALKTDVVVIGGGITGILAAYLVAKAGKRVCLLEREKIGGVDTQATTSHLSYVTDRSLSKLKKVFGEKAAGQVWRAGEYAINLIESIVTQEKIDCDFSRVPGFIMSSLKSETGDETSELKSEAALARRLGFDAEFVEATPYFQNPGVRYPNQAKIHPWKYLAGLTDLIVESGGLIYEQSGVTGFGDDPLTLIANGHQIKTERIVIATHDPLMGNSSLLPATFLQTKLAPYTSYVIGARIKNGMLPDALYWDTTDPYYYLRLHKDAEGDYLIFGGEDHKTGQVPDTEKNYARLEKIVLELFPGAKVDRRWSGQVIETHDGLPYIGETADKQFVATGFCGNGITFGTLAGVMAHDFVLGKQNSWQDLFDVNRMKLLGGALEYVKENVDFPYYLIKDRLTPADGESPSEVAPGDGKIIKVNGTTAACYRTEDGHEILLSPVCTHMGCIVRWNTAEKTWDCPCHGSRFRATGEVLAGPAEEPLTSLELDEENRRETKQQQHPTQSR